MSTDQIVVLGAREHNLRDVDLTLPRDSLVVFSGLSGSGKSSLAFDTIYQEGQRRFMESLSSYARQFLGKMEKPQVDHVDGLSPTISIDQKTVNRNPRSTVGTVTEILDHLRLLLARLGTPHCPKCDTPISALSPAQIAERVISLHPGARVLVLAPIVRDRKGEYRKELEELRKDGWARARIDGELRRLDEDIPLARYEKHSIEVVLDRLSAVPESKPRAVEAVERALRMAEGNVCALFELPEAAKEDEPVQRHFTWSSDRACPQHPEVAIPELEPRLFSFNAPQGACPDCNGLGELVGFDPALMVDEGARIPEALKVWNAEGRLPFSSVSGEIVRDLVRHLGGDLRRRWADQPEAVQRGVLLGEGVDWSYSYQLEQGKRTVERTRKWSGIAPAVQNIFHFTKHKGFERFRRRRDCPGCGGARLNPVALAVRFRGQNVAALSSMRVTDALEFFRGVRLRGDEQLIGQELLRELRDRLGFLDQVGLGYLSIDRRSTTLSGGEAQRIRLAAQVGSGLQGVTYVLDEPSIGLHPRDNRRLLDTLLRLRDQGNSVLVVEHDRETMEAADHLVDVGPGAGVEGGLVVASGAPSSLKAADSATLAYLRGDDRLPLPEARRPGNGERLRVVGARENNLQGVTVDFPLGCFIVVTGVSGSGKSSLISHVLQRALNERMRSDYKGPAPGAHEALEGVEHIDKLIVIDQSPIGRTPRSNPATYTGLFDEVRGLFAKLPEARARGYKPGRFSFNVAGGRCEECSGAGVQTIEMQFLADVEVTCEACGGRRFNAETLEIRYKGRSISDVLRMPIAEAAPFFANHRKIKRVLDTLLSVGMGYVSLGQPSTTLSGGEAQRIKLASELHRPSTGQTLYLLDEPTTGLHFKDVVRLLDALSRLVDQGNTVLVIEHDAEVIKTADHVIDMGPEGGDAGGQIVGLGAPEHIATLDTPTGRTLAALPDFGGPAYSFNPRRRRRRRHDGDLVIKGASCHNLKSVDLTLPKNSLAVITGVSGSGKTSLAFDTIFAEGQRRYVECMSTYARRFLGRLDRAPVTSVEGLAPAIAINQKAASSNPRSTVATVTEIYDYLRLLWARVGQPHCHICGEPIRGFSPSAGARHLQSVAEGRGWILTRLEPEEEAEARRKELLREGFLRLLVLDGEGPSELSMENDKAKSEAALKGGALLVIDRVKVESESRQRLSEALRTAYGYGDGRAALYLRDGALIELTEEPACPSHGRVLPPELSPRHFSFNSYVGACPRCEGTGRRVAVDLELLLLDPEQPLIGALDGRVGAVVKRSKKVMGRLNRVAEVLELKLKTTKVKDWTPEQREVLLNGLPGVPLTTSWTKKWGRTRSTYEEEFEWVGLLGTIDEWSSDFAWIRRDGACAACEGGRLRPEILAVTLAGRSISDFCALTVERALQVAEGLTLPPADEQVAEQPLDEVRGRLRFLLDVGLGYLSLDRGAGTLSGGEAQRIRLASQLGSGLTGCIYVLDEPTVGLHPRDTRRLLETLTGLRDLGNTVVVVEHDPDTIKAADYIVDMGPGAGEQGGEIVASGDYAAILADPASLTGGYLSGRTPMPRRAERRVPEGWMTLRGARTNNLHAVSVAFPVGALTVVTGVSGSGKSSLVLDTLVPALNERLGVVDQPPACEGLEMELALSKLVVVDQSPLGLSPRSTPATYTKVMDPLRELFAATIASQVRGYDKGRFSFNSQGGRCPHCEGRGSVLVEMHFLSDVWVTCEHCRGRRFNEATLEVRWQGLSIADVLDLRVAEAAEHFRNQRRIAKPLRRLVDVGLGYLRLGQPASTLSGGEAQRVKLARELGSRGAGAVYVLDEPTTGLHFADVEKLIAVLHRLVDHGASVIVIEHNTDLILNADHVIDVGPEGGDAGGRVVAAGSPAEVAAAGTATGLILREMFERGAGA